MLRLHHSLNGTWQFAPDPRNQGLAEGWPERGQLPAAHPMVVPSVWNLTFPGYEGAAFYATVFPVESGWRERAVRLRVEAANYRSQWWLNGHYLGAHEGGYTPFWFDVSPHLHYGEANRLVARIVDPPAEGEVDGIRLAETACAKEMWYYRYGGIWGAVGLEAGDRVWCADVFAQPQIAPPAVQVSLVLRNEGDRPERVGVRVLVLDPAEQVVGQWQSTAEPGPGESHLATRVPIPAGRLWSPESPYLYRVRVEIVRQGAVVDAVTQEFGLREFRVRQGEFWLNGHPIFLRGLLYQPNYPRTLAYPSSPDQPEQELRLIRSAGFNLVRFHVRPPSPAYLTLADALGLLVYAETALAWIADSPHLEERGRSEVTETIRRDRNHPSVVIWGLFNENQRAAYRMGRPLMELARTLDPTRPVIDNSGGAAAVDPGGGWVDRTCVLSPGAAAPEPLVDLHLYLSAPVSRSTYRWLAGFGGPRGLPYLPRSGYGNETIARELQHHLRRPGRFFVSEFGYGGLPDLAAVAAGFGDDRDLVDAREVSAFRQGLQEGLAERGLDRMLGGLAGLARAAQQIQAEGDRRQAEALRCNPRVSGYVLTQFNDAAWEMGAGLVDLWRKPKLALAALAAANAEQVLVLRLLSPVGRAGRRMRLEAGVLGTKPAGGRLTVVVETAAQPTVLTREVTLVEAVGATGRSPLQPILQTTFRLATTGRYRAHARLEMAAGRSLEGATSITVVPAIDLQAVGGRVCLLGPHVKLERRLGPAVSDRPRSGRVLVVPAGRDDAAGLGRALEFAAAGEAAILFGLDDGGAQSLSTIPRFGREVRAFSSLGLFVGCFHYLQDSPAFADLPRGCLAGEEYADLLPQYSLSELDGEVHAGCFTHLPYLAGRPGWRWGADLQVVPCGAGRLVLCQYRVLENLGRHPVADVLFRNLVELAR